MRDSVPILAILQVRMSSTRLPGKVMMDVLGRPMLERQIERINRARHIDRLCIATTTEPSDDPITAFCAARSIDYCRGSLDDVLDRYYQAAQQYSPSHVVRVTGDCPLIDATVIDQVIELHLSGKFDYTCNRRPPTYPDGLDVEICRFECLRESWESARLASEREHVTPFIWNRPERFRLGTLHHRGRNLSELRWTVDYARDLEFVRAVYQRLHPSKPDFDMYDVLNLVDTNPQLLRLNSDFERDEGYRLSLEKDRAV